MIAIISSLL